MFQSPRPALAATHQLRAFTLVELLIVVSLIALLLSLLVPSIGRIVYVSRKSACTSQYHQTGLVICSYTVDTLGFLPRQDVPVITGHNTWDVSNALPTTLIEQGMDYRFLYCPVIYNQPPKSAAAALQSMLDPTGNFNFSNLTTMWWVPRRDPITFYISDPNDPSDFPTSARCPSISKKPIMSDKICSPIVGIIDAVQALGGHTFNGQLESNSLLFGDGHTESPNLPKIQWRYSGNWGNFY